MINTNSMDTLVQKIVAASDCADKAPVIRAMFERLFEETQNVFRKIRVYERNPMEYPNELLAYTHGAISMMRKRLTELGIVIENDFLEIYDLALRTQRRMDTDFPKSESSDSDSDSEAD